MAHELEVAAIRNVLRLTQPSGNIPVSSFIIKNQLQNNVAQRTGI